MKRRERVRFRGMAEMLSSSDADVARAGALLRAGELVAVPTETVYGLAANAFREDSVRAIFAAKERPFFDPLIVHVHSLAQAGTLADVSHPFVGKLAAAFWPGPLTLVLPKKAVVPDVVTAGEPTVAVRMPAHPLMRRILLAADVPLAAPSANPFGYVSPTTAEHVRDSLGGRIGWIVDGGPCVCGVESTIVLVSDSPRLLRPGVITRERLEAALGVPVAPAKGHLEKLADAAEAESSRARPAPGMLKRHYSPRVPVRLFSGGEVPRGVPAGAAVVFQAAPSAEKAAALPADARIFHLSENGDQEEVARAVFSLLRRLDAGNFSEILVEKSPESGVGVAVNDRLSRAAAR